ncbi:Hint domain-containing protein [Shimia thalassica]|uniref:Hint domain-containing protein n=1 Tax=Shimia thalassica TaxID=1715693 RepID=UPI0027348D5F|nr:Hint domain-containing protein [Shimia thalassica]MDP2495066.1 Hint domain-containing protein [Shimia thalassica]
MGFPVADTGEVTEDSDVVGGLLTTSGDIDYLLGSDAGQWTAETISGSYGSSLVIDVDGNWTYTALNDHPDIEELEDGDTLIEVFNVTSNAGGSTVTITINGATDPPCFVSGTLINTPSGPRPVETLQIGDLVLTRDDGPQPIRWIAGARVDLTQPEFGKKFQPIRLAAHALGPGIPDRDLLLSPQHRVVISHSETSLLFGEREVLCAASHLVNGDTITRGTADEVTYFHILFDCHQVITSNGCASESFFPGDVGLDRLAISHQDELFTLFPELRSLPQSYGRTARMSLRAYEARLIRDRLSFEAPKVLLCGGDTL